MSLVTPQNQNQNQTQIQTRDIMILVSGASGHLGRATLSHLLAARAHAVGGTRHPGPGSTDRHLDFDDPGTLDFADVDTLVLVSAGTAEDDVVISRHARVIQAAERDGVGHLIYTSLTAAGDHLGFALAHRWTERRIKAGSVPWTILRNGLYAELIGHLLTPVEGVILAPFGDGAVAAVTRDDLALAAANVALDPVNHQGRTYDLVGSSAFTAAQVAEALGVTYQPSTLGQLRALLDNAGLLPFQPPMLVSIHAAITGGFLAGTGHDLQGLLGREPADALQRTTQVLNAQT